MMNGSNHTKSTGNVKTKLIGTIALVAVILIAITVSLKLGKTELTRKIEPPKIVFKQPAVKPQQPKLQQPSFVKPQPIQKSELTHTNTAHNKTRTEMLNALLSTEKQPIAKKTKLTHAKQQTTKKITARKKQSSKKPLSTATSNSYTLQLLGSHNQASIEKFIKKNRLQQQTKIFRTHRRGKPWYVLAFGQFKNPTQARMAIKTLPIAAKKLKPWARSLASLQRTIKPAG